MAIDGVGDNQVRRPPPPPPPPPAPTATPTPTPTPTPAATPTADVTNAAAQVADRGRAGTELLTGNAANARAPEPPLPSVPAGARTDAVYGTADDDNGLPDAPSSGQAAVTSQRSVDDRQQALAQLAQKAGVELPPESAQRQALDDASIGRRQGEVARALVDQAQAGRITPGGSVRAAGADVALSDAERTGLTDPSTRAQTASSVASRVAAREAFVHAAGGTDNAAKIGSAYAALPQGEKNSFTPPADEPHANSGGSFLTRALGGLRAAGGVVEGVVAGGLALAPEPTGLTKAGAVLVGAHALDDIQAGVRQAVTGEDTPTFTQQGASAVARGLGADPHTADLIGAGADVAAGLAGPAAGSAVLRAAARSGEALEGVPQLGRAATREVLATQAQSAGRAAEVASYASGWQKASLAQAVDRLGPGVKVSTTETGKVLYTSADETREIAQDPFGRYFTIRDMTNTTKRPYLDVNGQPIPNNVVNPATGKLRGLTKDEYRQMTHFAME